MGSRAPRLGLRKRRKRRGSVERKVGRRYGSLDADPCSPVEGKGGKKKRRKSNASSSLHVRPKTKCKPR